MEFREFLSGGMSITVGVQPFEDSFSPVTSAVFSGTDKLFKGQLPILVVIMVLKYLFDICLQHGQHLAEMSTTFSKVMSVSVVPLTAPELEVAAVQGSQA